MQVPEGLLPTVTLSLMTLSQKEDTHTQIHELIECLKLFAGKSQIRRVLLGFLYRSLPGFDRLTSIALDQDSFKEDVKAA